MSELINHGFGIVTFKNAHSVQLEEMLPKLKVLEDEALKNNFRLVYDDNGVATHAINEGGFIYALESVNTAPLRLQNLGADWYEEFESALYLKLLEYIELFPALLPCLWWKSTGHILSYAPGASLGIHCDNDVNYRYGSVPREQHATRNVVSAILFLNSCSKDFEGGTMTFPYADVEIIPNAGDMVFFPANYMAAHQINEVTSGKRYSYLAWFAQGSEHIEHNINPQNLITANGGQVWLQNTVADFDNYVSTKYGQNPPAELVSHRSRRKDHDN